MLSSTRKRPLWRPAAKVTVAATLAFALTAGLVHDPGRAATTSKAASPGISAACNQAITTAASYLRESAPPSTTGTHIESSAYTVSPLVNSKLQAVEDCTTEQSKDHVKQATLSYPSATIASLAINASIVLLASTTICAAAPLWCEWGTKLGYFMGGFFGSLSYQYLTTGAVDWKAAGYAFLDAIGETLLFSGAEALTESYAEHGVAETWNGIWQAIQSTANRFSGLGSTYSGYMGDMASWIWNNVISMQPGFVAYHGGASVEPVISPNGDPNVAYGLQFRDMGNYDDQYGWDDDDNDMYSGSSSNGDYNWDVELTGSLNGDGAYGYEIAPTGGNWCLEDDGGQVGDQVYYANCAQYNHNQYWYYDGDEWESSAGNCLNETPSGFYMATCDGITYQDDLSYKDDQFIPSPENGSSLQTSYQEWENNWQIYANDAIG